MARLKACDAVSGEHKANLFDIFAAISEWVNTTNAIRKLMFAALALISIVALAAAEGRAQDYVFERLWPQLPQPWHFNYPRGVAIDGQGNVFVADTLFNRIQVFDRDGIFLRKWGEYGSGDGQFDTPEGIAIDASGNVFVTDLTIASRYSIPPAISCANGVRGAAAMANLIIL